MLDFSLLELKKVGASDRVKDLRAKKRNMGTEEKQNQLDGPCPKCNGQCCRNYSICLSNRDILRIYEKMGKLDWIWAVPANRIDAEILHSFLLPEKGKLEEYVLCILRNRKETCVFLGKGNVCTIHDVRPMICRAYPFEIGEKGELIYKKNYRCPEGWQLDEVTKKKFLEDAETQLRELEEYGKICREWNVSKAKNGEFGKFLEFIMAKTG